SHESPLPPSTLFPYTTLFRSVLLAGSFGDSRYCNFLRWCGKDPRPIGGGHRSITDGTGSACHCHRNSCYGRPDGKRLVRRPSSRDRKSTRLNSSHVSRSYAVL